ncbi:pyridine nucleotide-disulphide oxidoreductase associated with reductive pyrimidine catabolism [Limimaricola cinnabarinus LL-001]|uniref:Pyridine nucleotide-disulphide oxidoreductase associated with reductive pyrimidine catabolism n=1 Tax=Limimaricola cinnabarinus LL-001 TaxID=1337093 RepID=U2Z0D5_9RHOB|nr:pyridine nucleotide-disulphide oxidoreductase associated with reductive pyrimidine catabolism [Limimaricola cinnabarinus LL-001]
MAADRCYFCHDAPCVTACPTEIDIPLFIREIQAGRPETAAREIFEANILGGMCARVCPTEVLCEGACVREAAEGKPVQIGLLQRHATDSLMARQGHPFTRAARTGKRVAVVGAGPAGLSCAHRLARHGHDVVIFEGAPKPGGLNEYGIAAYKSVDEFAAREAAWIMEIGGIELRHGQWLGGEITLETLRDEYDAVFLGIGLSGVNALGLDGPKVEGMHDAVTFISALRQCEDLSTLPIGRDVVVIGGGMTAIDCAVQAKGLGAETVTLVYRRARERMGASRFEQDLAAQRGVRLIFEAAPVAVEGEGRLSGVVFERMGEGSEGLAPTGDRFTLPADQMFRAVGQRLGDASGLKTVRGKVVTQGSGRTDMDKVWAGGDCGVGGDDLTVTAVAQGRDAAEDIHGTLTD